MKKLLVWIVLALCIVGCSNNKMEKSRLEVLGGKIDHNMYVNAYFNIVANFDDSWEVFSTEDIENQEELELDGTAYVVFFAQKDYGLQSANVVIEDINYNSDEDTLMNKTKSALKNDLKKQGIKNISQEINEMNFAGKTVNFVLTTGTFITNENKEVDIFTRQYVIEKNRYVAVVTITSLKDDYTEDIASYFYNLD